MYIPERSFLTLRTICSRFCWHCDFVNKVRFSVHLKNGHKLSPVSIKMSFGLPVRNHYTLFLPCEHFRNPIVLRSLPKIQSEKFSFVTKPGCRGCTWFKSLCQCPKGNQERHKNLSFIEPRLHNLFLQSLFPEGSLDRHRVGKQGREVLSRLEPRTLRSLTSSVTGSCHYQFVSLQSLVLTSTLYDLLPPSRLRVSNYYFSSSIKSPYIKVESM